MISYKPLLKLLIDRGIKKTELAEAAGITHATLAKFGTDKFVSLEVIDKVCAALNCQPGDILEFVPDKTTE